MPALQRKITVTVTLLLALGVVALLPLVANPRSGPREVVLVARQMSFYLATDPATPNPTIRVAPGEEVRVVLRNEDSGVTHYFAVAAWKVATAPLDGEETGSVTFRAPGKLGRHVYACTPHAKMMKGILEVK